MNLYANHRHSNSTSQRACIHKITPVKSAQSAFILTVKMWKSPKYPLAGERKNELVKPYNEAQ
jgi:hypothetical protein